MENLIQQKNNYDTADKIKKIELQAISSGKFSIILGLVAIVLGGFAGGPFIRPNTGRLIIWLLVVTAVYIIPGIIIIRKPTLIWPIYIPMIPSAIIVVTGLIMAPDLSLLIFILHIFWSISSLKFAKKLKSEYGSQQLS